MIVHTSEPLPRLGEKDWKVLMERIDSKKCTPIIGSETRSEDFAVRSEIAREWAQEYDFPLSSSVNLARVSRFVSANYDAEYAKKMLVKRLANAPKPDLDDPADPYRILARLQLPIYITTNYDDFMFQALVKADRAPKAEMCRWWRDAVQSSIFDDGFEPKAATPVVFHFHGVTEELDSLVLTEDDYFEFLINVSKDNLVPPRIEKAFSGSSLLLLGYRLDDWDFRVL